MDHDSTNVESTRHFFSGLYSQLVLSQKSCVVYAPVFHQAHIEINRLDLEQYHDCNIAVERFGFVIS